MMADETWINRSPPRESKTLSEIKTRKRYLLDVIEIGKALHKTQDRPMFLPFVLSESIGSPSASLWRTFEARKGR